MRGLLLVGLGACTSQYTVNVMALRGDQPEPHAHVISHRLSGERIATLDVGPDGRAAVPVDDDSFVTVIYPFDPTDSSNGSTAIYTVAVAGLPDDIVIHGPVLPPPPQWVGEVVVDPGLLTPAVGYVIHAGDTNVNATSFPKSVPIDASSVGRDGRVPIVVTTADGASYAAGFVRLVGGTAAFTPTTWSPAVVNVPVLAPDVALTHVGWAVTIDGVAFQSDLSAGATLWDGLPIEHAVVSASAGDQVSSRSLTRDLPGAPAQLVFVADDFLAPLRLTTTMTGMPPRGWPHDSLTFDWKRADVGADLVRVSLYYQSAHTGANVGWQIALPPDAASFRTPAFEGELDDLSPVSVDVVVNYVDSTSLDGFADARATDSFAVPLPIGGQLRGTATTGTTP